MPNLTFQIGALGPTLQVVVAASQERIDALNAAGQPIPPPQIATLLVDTGAGPTCIDLAVLNQLGLTAKGSMPVHTPSTGQAPQVFPTYDVGFAIIAPANVQHSLLIGTTEVVGSDFSQMQIQGLLGRDILSKCLLVYNGNLGFFTLGF